MFKEHERVVLTRCIAEQGLIAGDIGTVVHVHRGGRAFEVEFITLSGKTVAVATVTPSHVRGVRRGEIAHARLVATG